MTTFMAALKRLTSEKVNYMELPVRGGAFSCGNCRFQRDGHCGNPRVLSPISPSFGCCNLFEPAHYEPVPVEHWRALAKL